ncbi:hypothetical protein Q8A67_015257 [Cirrhinus molitorella]|uniref:Fibrinogen C-terminal domain-containing protein n=1 Tax=Cirrhinus molitorella TaxID=172907 RepID=A0AA88TIN9_9TELE|nr:hypothetical protein Q8A67_015257 [Cirrhinus molitorella]
MGFLFMMRGEEMTRKRCSLHASGFGGTAGRTSSLTNSGSLFSTKDQDNDQCSCKCAQMATGGWWFDACGPSNLNGIYYSGSSNVIRYNSIKWYYWKGPSWMATMTTMMIRPLVTTAEQEDVALLVLFLKSGGISAGTRCRKQPQIHYKETFCLDVLVTGGMFQRLP